MMQEPKSCPFCSGKAHLFSVTLPMVADSSDIYVQCGACDAIGPTILFDQDIHDAADISDLEAAAIAAWNTRAGFATIPDPQAYMEAARGMREALAPFARAQHIIATVDEDGRIRCVLTYQPDADETFTLASLDNARAALATFGATLGEQ